MAVLRVVWLAVLSKQGEAHGYLTYNNISSYSATGCVFKGRAWWVVLVEYITNIAWLHSRSGSCRLCHREQVISQRKRHLALSRSEEHTSELQSRFDLVCRLLLENTITNLNAPGPL